MEKTVLILDSSQIETFLDCPTLWYYKYKRSLIPNAQRSNTPMNMGTYGHKLLEIIYKERAKGNHANATSVAFAYNIDTETCRCAHGHEHHRTMIVGMPERCCAIGCTCDEFVPVPFPLDPTDREFTKNRVLEYTFVEGTAIPEFVPSSPDHVEVGFSYNLYEDEERLYILEGRIDLLGKIANNCESGWADHKFQARERDLYLKSIQFRNYSMVTQLPIGVVNYIRFAKKIEKDKTFKRAVISFSRQEMEWWKDRLIATFNRIENATTDSLFKNDEQWYLESDTLRNRAMCGGKFGYACDYTPMCENAMLPALIQINEQSVFKQKPAWRPW